MRGRSDFFVDFPGNIGRIPGKEIRAETISFASGRDTGTAAPNIN